jgi:prolyl-tRNA synthetase
VNVHNKHDAAAAAPQDATQLLIRAGYLRQAYAGIFHMLPLGLRVQDKLERLIDKHMKSIKASKVSLSSLSSKALWAKSGRWRPGAEFFAFKDRRDTEWLLAPTHEEEITTLLADLIQSRQQLPLRLYQIGRKYRDEKRPRGGLLRGREFLMKDLYTFDATAQEAHATYDDIRGAYRAFLDELTVDYVEARADSGDMGGDLSHEYHFPNPAGEDTVITCTHCGFARNEEFVSRQSHPPRSLEDTNSVNDDKAVMPLTPSHPAFLQQDFLSQDGCSLVRAIAPRAFDDETEGIKSVPALNPYAIKAALSGVVEIDAGLEEPLGYFEDLMATTTTATSSNKASIFYVLDSRVHPRAVGDLIARDKAQFSPEKVNFYLIADSSGDDLTSSGINLLKHRSGDPCPECADGQLQLQKAIEIGHTFHLGTRYSSKLGLAVGSSGGKDVVPVEMGCHGIGVSRLIAAVASCLADGAGLNWPRVIAPFEAVIVVQQQEEKVRAAERLYDGLAAAASVSSGPGSGRPVDVLLDDRPEQGLGWKLKDADMIGYPVIVVVGKAFDQGKVEVQCRRLKVKEDVHLDDAVEFVRGLLGQL